MFTTLALGDNNVQRLAVRDELRGPAPHQQQRGSKVPEPKTLHGSPGTAPMHQLVIFIVLLTNEKFFGFVKNL